MIDLEKALETCRVAKQQIRLPYDHHGAAPCTRTFTILPLRYAAIGGYEAPLSLVPDLPEHLQSPHRVGALSTAKYAVRTLREGFLYVLEQRRIRGQYRWLTPFQVHADGTLSPTSVDEPTEPGPISSNPLDTPRSIQRLFTIRDLDDIEHIRLFFSPDRLTPAALNDLEMRRSSIPALSIRKFAAAHCPSPEPNVLSHDQLDLVADFAAESSPGLRTLLDQQFFNTPYSLAKIAVQQALAPDPTRIGPGKLNPQGVAIVVEDAIGITQELNAWRNAALESVKDWLDARDAPNTEDQLAPTNEHKLVIANAFAELHKNFTEHTVSIHMRKHIDNVRTDLGTITPLFGLESTEWQQSHDDILEKRRRPVQEDLETRAKNGEYVRLFEEKYLPRVDTKAMQRQIENFETKCQQAQYQANVRAADHLLWLQHTQFLEALKAYDTENLTNGLCFAHQTGLCVMGMESVEGGAELMKNWWQSDTLEPDNLALRSFVFNQKGIAEALSALQARPQFMPGGEDELAMMETALKQGKDLATEFGFIDGHLDNLSQHAHINTAGALNWIGQLGRETLRAGAPNSLDRLLHERLSTYLTAAIGEQAVNLRMAEYKLAGTSASPERVAAPVLRRLDEAYVTTIMNARSNSFYKSRVASGLLFLEGSLLLLQGRREDMDRRFVSEVMASALTTAAAGMELLAVGTEQALSQVGKGSLTARGALISLGRYRLFGASLAAAGGIVSIWWDATDTAESLGKARASSSFRQYSISVVYGSRAAATALLISTQSTIALSQAGAYFRFLGMKSTDKNIKILMNIIARTSAQLAGRHAIMLLLGSVLWIAGAALIISTVILLIIEEDDLEKWCDSCCYSLNHFSKKFTSLESELEELTKAIRSVS
jgi:hypothetical protein